MQQSPLKSLTLHNYRETKIALWNINIENNIILLLPNLIYYTQLSINSKEIRTEHTKTLQRVSEVFDNLCLLQCPFKELLMLCLAYTKYKQRATE